MRDRVGIEASLVARQHRTDEIIAPVDGVIEFGVAAIVAGVASESAAVPSITNSDDVIRALVACNKAPDARNRRSDARNKTFLPGEESDDSLMTGRVEAIVNRLRRLSDLCPRNGVILSRNDGEGSPANRAVCMHWQGIPRSARDDTSVGRLRAFCSALR